MMRALRCACRWSALLLLIGTMVAAPANAATTQLTCPTGTGSMNLQADIYYFNQPCAINGDIVLGGTATLVVLQTNVTVNGNILLSGSSRLIVTGGTLALDNKFVFDHRIEAHDNAQIHFIDSVLKTNVSSPGHSLASQYIAEDQSVLFVQNSGVLGPDSWLLGEVRGHAAVHAINSNFPSEIYPHADSTVILEGAATNSRVWLEFLDGSDSLIEQLPDELVPFSWSFGRRTPGMTNVAYQVEVINATPTIGVSSHPGSHVTFRNTQARLAIGYFLTDLNTPQQIVGVGPLSRNVSLEHQARLFKLDNANIFEFAWQIYSANPNVVQPEPVVVRQSMINEVAALERGRVAVDACLLQWAVIAAIGPGSTIEIAGSTINSQSIIAATDARVHIDSSEIFGSLVEANDDSTILFSNARFRPNICHALCLPACASPDNGGFEGNRCNPFNPAGGESVFRAGDRATIAALGVDALTAPLTVGDTINFLGDLFVFSGPGAQHTYSYTLRHYRLGSSGPTTIVANGQGSKRHESLGTLNTSSLVAGDYVAILELNRDGQQMAVVTRDFKLLSR